MSEVFVVTLENSTQASEGLETRKSLVMGRGSLENMQCYPAKVTLRGDRGIWVGGGGV